MAFIGTLTSSGSSFDGKLQIDSAGLNIIDTNAGTYEITTGGHIQLGTSASNCLQIFHDATSNNSFISEVGTGDMCIVTNGTNLYLQKDATPGAAEDMIHCIANGAVKLFYDGGSNTTAKLETTATGVKVNGDLEVTGTGGGGLPVGAIILWSGATNAIPAGFALCNGQNGTPNLQDKFIVGAGSGYAVAATGGSADATLVSHTHNLLYNHGAFGGSSGAVTPRSGNTPVTPGISGRVSTESNHTHSGSTGNPSDRATNSQGSSATNANLPPYYALCYIMKT